MHERAATIGKANVLFAFAILGMAGSLVFAGGEPAPPRIILKWFDSYRLIASSSELTGQHVESLFQRVGVSVIWDKANAITPQPGELELRVLLRPADASGLGLPANTMGAILNNKSPQRTLFIFFPAVARVLGYKPEDLAGQPLRDQDLVLARGLSRVIVHEVIHAVAPKLLHASEGLTRSRLGLDGIAYTKATIDPRSAAVFRAELTKLLTAQTPRMATSSPDPSTRFASR